MCSLSDLRPSLGVLEPPREQDEMEGMDALLLRVFRLAERELLPKLGVLGWADGAARRDHRSSLSSRSRESSGEMLENRCFFTKCSEGDDAEEVIVMGDSLPMDARAATSKAETAFLVDTRALVSTYICAATC